MNPLSPLFLMPMALVKIKRSFLLKLTVWLQEHTLMRAHCKPVLMGFYSHEYSLDPAEVTWAVGRNTFYPAKALVSSLSPKELFFVFLGG